MTAFPAMLATMIAVSVTLVVVAVNTVLAFLPNRYGRPIDAPFQGGRLLQVAWLIACGLWFAWWLGTTGGA